MLFCKKVAFIEISGCLLTYLHNSANNEVKTVPDRVLSHQGLIWQEELNFGIVCNQGDQLLWSLHILDKLQTTHRIFELVNTELSFDGRTEPLVNVQIFDKGLLGNLLIILGDFGVELLRNS